MEDKKCLAQARQNLKNLYNGSTGIEQISAPCADRLMTRLSASSFEDLSELEQTEVAEHARSCSACSALLTGEQRLAEVFQAFTSPERYPDEPEFSLSEIFSTVRERKRQEVERKKRERDRMSLLWSQYRTLIALLGAIVVIGMVLIILIPTYIGAGLALAQSLVMVASFWMRRKKAHG